MDVVTRTMYVDPVTGVPTPDGYLLYMYNTTFLCSVYLSMECVEAYGPAGCYLQAFAKPSGVSVLVGEGRYAVRQCATVCRNQQTCGK